MSFKILVHKYCSVARGLHSFQCLRCRQEAMNYTNSIDICDSCAEKLGICVICGEPLNDDDVEIVP